MKYALLLCVLIAFSNSKLPKLGIKSFLESIKSDYDEDQNGPSCRGVESKDACTAISLTNKGEQCCWETNRASDEPKSSCDTFPKPSKDLQDLVNNKQFSPLYKEFAGFFGEISSSSNKIDSIVECSDGDLEYKLDTEFTEDEKKILESENHCLNYTMSSFFDMSKKFECKKGELLQSSKDAGITCGDLAITLKGGATETTFKTCMPFPYELLSKVKVPEMIKEMVKQMIIDNPVFPFKASQFNLELSDSKGHKIKFDSETSEITPEGDDDHGDGGGDVTPDGQDDPKTDNSIILNISKYLFLFSLFLF